MKLYLENQLREASGETADNLLRKGWQEQPPAPDFDAATQACEWVGGAWVVRTQNENEMAQGAERAKQAYEATVTTVKRAAIRLALARTGLYVPVVAAINGIADPVVKLETQIWWDSDTVRSDHPVVKSLAATLGKTDAEVAEVFALAKQIDDAP